MGKPHSALFGIPVNEIASICGVDLSTARRWKRGAICPPETALMVLRIIYHGSLDDLGPEWVGWMQKDGVLVSPDGWRITRNDALTVPLMHGQISALRQELASIKESPPDIEDQPKPDEWTVMIA